MYKLVKEKKALFDLLVPQSSLRENGSVLNYFYLKVKITVVLTGQHIFLREKTMACSFGRIMLSQQVLHSQLVFSFLAKAIPGENTDLVQTPRTAVRRTNQIMVALLSTPAENMYKEEV
jgi:hypothetical protein